MHIIDLISKLLDLYLLLLYFNYCCYVLIIISVGEKIKGMVFSPKLNKPFLLHYSDKNESLDKLSNLHIQLLQLYVYTINYSVMSLDNNFMKSSKYRVINREQMIT